MNPFEEYARNETRRQFFGRGKNVVGLAALASLMGGSKFGAGLAGAAEATGLPGLAHFAPKAKHVIYLHMVGGPSQMDLYDYKPKMNEFYDKDLPESIRMGQRLTTMTSGQKPVPRRAVEVQVRPVRPARHVDQRDAAVHVEDGRRRLLHPQHEHRRHQPRGRPSP